MQTLTIKNIETHSFHGCLPEESIIGCRFSTEVEFQGDFSKAMLEDELSHVVDYVLVHKIVREEMAIPARLIEHVVHRILVKMKGAFPQVSSIHVSVTKYNPPVNGQLGEAVFRAGIS